MNARTVARAAALSIAATLALTACNGDGEPTETPTPEPTTTAPSSTPEPTPTTEPTPTPTPTDPNLGQPAPPLPDTVGEWTTLESSSSTIADYEREGTDAWITVVAWPDTTKEQIQQDIPDVARLDGWLCGRRDSDPDQVLNCAADAWDGTVDIRASGLDAEGVVAFGDELLAAWQ